jgi:SAM-dependent methyltransferase
MQKDGDNHDRLVIEQFETQAKAYLDSPVHARGEDLDELARLVGHRPDAYAMDLGCGGGHVAFLLAPLVRKVVAYDLSSAMVATVNAEAARRGLDNLEARVGSVEAVPCPDGSFDLVVTRHSAHHWHDLGAGLSQARRLVKADGLAVFMDVAAPSSPLLDTWFQSIELLRDPSHVRDRTVEEWADLAAKAGFRPETVRRYRVRLDFASWVARMKTPEAHVTAIRSLQRRAVPEVAGYFAFEADGSFTIDTMLMTARPV